MSKEIQQKVNEADSQIHWALAAMERGDHASARERLSIARDHLEGIAKLCKPLPNSH